MIGKIISNYKITAVIGEGGMGEVFVGEHIQIPQKKAAIKVLHANLFKNKEVVERFKNEASTLAHLDHPNIVTLYDYIENDEGFFLVLEYVKGRELEDYIKKERGPIPEDETKSLMIQVLQAFQYAHDKKIVHRDIKPANILIKDGDNTPKVLDFGIAKMLGDSDKNLTKAGTKMGTVYYMSPEQVKGKEVDHRSDIYSLGVTMYQMLTGQNPYHSKTTEFEIQESILKQDLPPASSIYPGVSKRMEAIIAKATHKDPKQRYQSCKEFIDDLAGDDEIIVKSTKSKKGKRKKLPFGWIFAFVIVAGLIGAYYGLDGDKWIKKLPIPKLSFFMRDYPLTTDYLPSNVSYFGSVSVIDLALKAEAYEFEDLRIFSDLLTEIKGESRDTYEKIQSLKNDGENEFGIDFYDDIVFAGTNLKGDENYSLIGFSIADNEMFEDFIKDLLDDKNISVRKKYNDEYNTFITREFAIAWSDDVGFVVIAQDNESRGNFKNICEDIFKQEEEDCLTENKYFQSFYKGRGDITCYVDFQSLSEIDKIKHEKDLFESDRDVRTMYKTYPSMPSVDEIMENTKIIFDISFTEEKMSVKLKADVTGTLNDFINENSPFSDAVSQNMVKMLPSSIMAGALSLDGPKLLEYTSKGVELLKKQNARDYENTVEPFETYTGYSPNDIT
jgi:tRNA A-37 threonylcarbamoyl transferase component Bud32